MNNRNDSACSNVAHQLQETDGGTRGYWYQNAGHKVIDRSTYYIGKLAKIQKNWSKSRTKENFNLKSRPMCISESIFWAKVLFFAVHNLPSGCRTSRCAFFLDVQGFDLRRRWTVKRPWMAISANNFFLMNYYIIAYQFSDGVIDVLATWSFHRLPVSQSWNTLSCLPRSKSPLLAESHGRAPTEISPTVISCLLLSRMFVCHKCCSYCGVLTEHCTYKDLIR